MGLYNRFSGTNQPADWKDTHPLEGNADKNMDWFSWHIAVHPFTDMLRLYVEGDLGSGQTAINRIQGLFDLSQTEVDQVMEIWGEFINNPAGDTAAQRNNVERFQGVLRALEREIPQRIISVSNGSPATDEQVSAWLYNKLGVTTQDDR